MAKDDKTKKEEPKTNPLLQKLVEKSGHSSFEEALKNALNKIVSQTKEIVEEDESEPH